MEIFDKLEEYINWIHIYWWLFDPIMQGDVFDLFCKYKHIKKLQINLDSDLCRIFYIVLL